MEGDCAREITSKHQVVMCEMTTLSPLVCSHLVVKLVRTGYQDMRLHGDTGLLISESHTSQCVYSDLYTLTSDWCSRVLETRWD